jgi:predicted lipoprotein with Yx(FWY)xxD motif
VGTKLGAVLDDANGRTLYTLTNNGAPVPCTGQCAAIWPPLLVPAGTATVKTAAGVKGVGTMTRGDQVHVTEMDLPVYRFSGDANPGDTNGDGIKSFGGLWRAARPVGALPKSAPASAGAGSTGGYGY